MNKLLLAPVLVLALAAAAVAQPAQPAYRVADINTTQEDFTDPLFTGQNFAVLGTTVFYLLNDSVHGVELWKTDGSAAGTTLVKDVCPGVCWGWPRNLTVWNGAVYFSADDGVHGFEPWKSDGTAAGTALVADVNPGLSSSDPQFLAAGGTLYMTVDDGVHGRELWKTEGSAAGTRMVADIQPGPVGSSPRLWLDLGGGKLLINADDGVHGREPWISDGTGPGTVLLADINPGSSDSTVVIPPFNIENDAFALGGGAFLFTADDGVHGLEPWKSDGTPGGTALFLDINLGSAESDPHGFTRLGSTIVFGAATAATNTELWSTDGTPGGTALLKDINPGTGNAWVHGLTASGGQAYFFATDATTGQELWKTDGTAAGTVQVKDINPGSGYGINIYARPLIRPFNGGVMVLADDGTHGLEPWMSDGTAAGTRMLKDILPGTGWGIDRFTDIGVVGGIAIFRGITADHGAEIWKTDGTTAGTVEVKDAQALASSFEIFNHYPPTNFRALAGKTAFDANDGLSGVEPWITDGTAAGTEQLADLAPGIDWSAPTASVPVGGTNLLAGQDGSLWTTDGTHAGTSPLVPPSVIRGSNLFPALGAVFFSGFNDTTDPGLWKTDGTPGGTVGLSGLSPTAFTPFGSLLLFLGSEGGSGGLALWRTDGTGAGTYPLTFGSITNAQPPTPLGATALFSASVPGSGQELCRTDGSTSAGTSLLKDLRAGAASSDPQQLVRLGGVVVFSAFDDATGRELYASDGTAAGTVLLKDINPGAGSSLAVDSVPVLFGNRLVFLADDGVHGRELWKTDGTAAGTVLLKDIFPGARSGEIEQLTVAGNRLFFVADDGVHGRELWSSDGTTAGTSMVADLIPGAGSPVIQSLAAVRHTVVFSADDGVHGRELWRSNGAAVGTFQVQDLAPGAAPSSPLDFTPVGSNVYFAANDGVTGFEPWAVPVSTLLTTFQDVPASYWAWRFIEALAIGGVTGGCGAGSFCPGALVSRAQMAIFILTARGTPPPPATGTLFQDVPAGYWAGPWIEELAREGIASGCSASPPLFCPNNTLTRAEMAVWLIAARHENPPPATGTRFADVPASYYAARWIEQLAADGITAGCGGGNYCPEQPITRGEMAVFLATAFHLPLP
ncbi:MAG TPA: ELWxxDGT repeat protein [Thermoanaerobaculia bacterium]|jgi:ELWxxDGT repeat protein